MSNHNVVSSTVANNYGSRPFDTWGGGGAMVFLCDQTFFSTASLNVQFFSDLIKSKQFFSHHLFQLILLTLTSS